MSDNKESTKSLTIIDDDKNTELHYAAASGDMDAVLNLLTNCGKVDMENYLGWTPMMMACRNGHVNVVKLLLEHRGDTTRKNKFGANVFLISIASGNLELVTIILEYLLSGGVSRQSMEQMMSPISLAILFNHEAVAKYLIEHSFNVNAVTKGLDLTPLMFATALDYNWAVAVLTKHNANTLLKNYSGETAADITNAKLKKNITEKVTTLSKDNPKSKTVENDQHLMPPPPAPAPPVQYYPQNMISCYQQAQMPYIMITPTPQNSPQYIMTPSPNPNQNAGILFPVQQQQQERRSSNVMTPAYFSPAYMQNVSPITPMMNHQLSQQVFFPPDFSPSQLMPASPAAMANFYNNPDFLNMRIDNGVSYMSTIPGYQTQFFNFPSPCV